MIVHVTRLADLRCGTHLMASSRSIFIAASLSLLVAGCSKSPETTAGSNETALSLSRR